MAASRKPQSPPTLQSGFSPSSGGLAKSLFSCPGTMAVCGIGPLRRVLGMILSQPVFIINLNGFNTRGLVEALFLYTLMQRWLVNVINKPGKGFKANNHDILSASFFDLWQRGGKDRRDWRARSHKLLGLESLCRNMVSCRVQFPAVATNLRF